MEFSRKFKDECRDRGCTPAGRHYVLQCADPFHDANLQIVGMPDATGGRSYMRNVRKEVTITKPTALAAGNWDAHITVNPLVLETDNAVLDGVSYQNQGNEAGRLTFPTPGCNYPATGQLLTVNSVLSGDPTYDPGIGYSNTQWSGITVSGLTLAANQRRYRICGMGYEVHNTTAATALQGSVTDYRVDASPHRGTVTWESAAAPGLSPAMPAIVGTSPPRNLDDAKQINGVSRKALEGSLVVCTRDNYDQDADIPSVAAVLLRSPGLTAGASAFASPDNQGDFDSGEQLASVYNTQYNLSGSYYTGLSEDTSLTIVLHAFIEVFPSADDSSMEHTSPSPSLDNCAFECLSAIQSHLLAGYPVADNDAGDFFRKVYHTLKSATQYGHKVAHSLAGAPGVLGRVAKGIDIAAEGALMVDDGAARIVRGLANQNKSKKKKKPVRGRN